MQIDGWICGVNFLDQTDCFKLLGKQKSNRLKWA